MITLLREWFSVNRPLVFFVYGQVFFVLGLAIALQSRRYSRLNLARSLPWLTGFGFLHGLNEWGDLFIPIQSQFLGDPILAFLNTVQHYMLAASFALLFQVGIKLLRPLPEEWRRLWLLSQTLTYRLWGRTGLYQSSGAFGLRDQLQDVLALHTRPGIAHTQILDAAQHRFEAGDVLHWLNPPVGRGVRTRFLDDLLWLPFVTAEYIATTGDVSILIERIPFLKGEM